MTLEITPYQSRFKQDFYDMNIAWLAKYFTVEPQHIAVLIDPEKELIKGGGEVFFALEDGKPVGAVGMKAYPDGVFELTKLAVLPAAQGDGIGRKLCEAVTERFLEKAGTRLFLETHSKLKPALALYEKLNFTYATNPAGDLYDGTDCYMEWQGEKVPEQGLTVALATSESDIAAVKDIFAAFLDFMPIDFGFQGIDAEMAGFPDGYEFLVLAKRDGHPVGAVALKEHSPETCEMKRLFVQPTAQGLGVGKLLCEHLLAEAKARGYNTMLLDSLRRLKAAVALYQGLGFSEIEAYNYNPEKDVFYMSRSL